jgi:hypothetical protein
MVDSELNRFELAQLSNGKYSLKAANGFIWRVALLFAKFPCSQRWN